MLFVAKTIPLSWRNYCVFKQNIRHESRLFLQRIVFRII